MSRLTEYTTEPLAIDDLLDHALSAGLDEADLRGLASFAGVPLKDDSGDVIGFVGAFDTTVRRWTSSDKELLSSLGGLVPPLPSATWARTTGEVARLAGDLSDALVTISDGFRGLVTHAASHDDAVLQRRAGVAERHLDDLHAHATLLRTRVAQAGAPVTASSLFDLGAVVEAAVREAADLVGAPLPQCQVPQGPLSVAGNPVAVRRALVQLFTSALVVASAEAVSVRLESLETSSGSLEGSLSAELTLTVHGVALSVGDLARALSRLLDPDCGVLRQWAPARIEQSPREVRLEAPGLRVRSADQGTRVLVHWPVDLG